MRSERRIVILAAVVVLLGAVYAAGLLLNRQPAPAVVVPAFRTNTATRIVAGSVDLRKSAGGWEVAIGGSWYPADPNRVGALLVTLSGLTASRVASRSRADWATFRVGDANGSPLTVFAGDRKLAELYVGQSATGGGVFVRSARAVDVYEVSGKLSDYVSGGSRYWSYLRILPRALKIDSLQTIAVTAHGFSVGGDTVNTSYLLVSSVAGGKSAWIERGGGPALDQRKVLELEGEIVDMVGDSFVTGKSPAAAGLDKPVATITVTDQQGGKWTLLVGDRHGAQFYLKREDLPYIYLVNEWTLHRAIPALGALTS